MSPKWILIAEDSQNDADLTLRVLTPPEAQVRSEVVVVRDGSEALDCLYRRNRFQLREGENPAFLLLDLKMPKVDGWEVLRRVKADARLKTIPVVVFSSSREEADLARCYEMGANAYVVKPLAFQEFVTVLGRLRAFWIATNEPPPRTPETPDH